MAKTHTETEQTHKPGLYQLVLKHHNSVDEHKILAIFERFFDATPDTAQEMYEQLQNDGKISCGVFTHGIAETMIAQICKVSEQLGSELTFTMEAMNNSKGATPC
tara:strand:- start:13493 stop:13807 length:315 start_codon:yes stop_codon:yes gene_type:complete